MGRPRSGSATDWIAIEGAYRLGEAPLRVIAEKHGVTEGAIRLRAKKHGWTRDPVDTKRRIVAAAMSGAGETTRDNTQNVVRNIQAAASQDIEDMNRGLRIQRLCLLSLETSAQGVDDPREVKIIIDATSAAIASIRSIRQLDESPVAQPKPGADEEITAEQLQADIDRVKRELLAAVAREQDAAHS